MQKTRPDPIIFALVFFAFLSPGSGYALTPDESLKKNFPAIHFDSVDPSVIPGLYEVTSGQQIFYYSPEAQCLIGGPIIMKGGRNITEEKVQILRQKQLTELAAKAKDIKLTQALKMGSGKHRVIEITNPDCGHCRRAAQFFQGRTDVTKYVFFLPFGTSREAEAKIRYILCAKDRAKAYHEAMTGKLDDMRFSVCSSEAVEGQLQAHREVAAMLGINSTPVFFINDQPVIGANMPLIEKLLEGKKAE